MIVNINPDPVCNKFDVTKSWEEQGYDQRKSKLYKIEEESVDSDSVSDMTSDCDSKCVQSECNSSNRRMSLINPNLKDKKTIKDYE